MKHTPTHPPTYTYTYTFTHPPHPTTAHAHIEFIHQFLLYPLHTPNVNLWGQKTTVSFAAIQWQKLRFLMHSCKDTTLTVLVILFNLICQALLRTDSFIFGNSSLIRWVVNPSMYYFLYSRNKHQLAVQGNPVFGLTNPVSSDQCGSSLVYIAGVLLLICITKRVNDHLVELFSSNGKTSGRLYDMIWYVA